MIQDELKDGSIVTIGVDDYVLVKQFDATCIGCSFYVKESMCNKPIHPYCSEGDDYYIYIKQES